jgi:hypothetical protein
MTGLPPDSQRQNGQFFKVTIKNQDAGIADALEEITTNS